MRDTHKNSTIPKMERRRIASRHISGENRRMSIAKLPIDLDHERIAEFCRRHGIIRLSLFGSVLREDFGPESDIDVLVEFPAATPSLLELGGMQQELSAVFGRTVDLKTWGFLSDSIRRRVATERYILLEVGGLA